MRQQFNLELSKQHPDWKVETRDGRNVRIICWDKKTDGTKSGAEQIVALVSRSNGLEKTLHYDKYGRCMASGMSECPKDLFLVTPEEELTPFEQYVENLLNLSDGEGHARTSVEKTKEAAKELLGLAEKELASRYKTSSDLNGFAYGKGYEDGKAEALKKLFNSVFPIDTPTTMVEFLNRLQDSAIASYNHGFDEGKKVALKDLPRWKSMNFLRIPKKNEEPRILNTIGGDYLVYGNYKISIDSLLNNLPKEDNHE